MDNPGAGITVAALLKWGTDALMSGDSPRLDCEILLAHAIAGDRAALYRDPGRCLGADERACFERLIGERARGRPVAQLVGRAGFWSMQFIVDEHVLAPRPETEMLVELALAREDPGTVVADLGCGSGAIAIALACERPQWTVVACDSSASALRIADHNARRLCPSRVHFVRADWLAPFRDGGLDVIVSNPPYVESGDPRLLDSDIRFEPVAALAAGRDGLAAIRRIIDDSPRALRAGGRLLLEHGYNQAAAVRELMHARGFQELATERDFAGHERVTIGHRP